MRSSPRKTREEGARCEGALPSGVETTAQLARLPIVELRHQATAVHGLRNAAVLGRQELVERLGRHFREEHGLVLEEGGQVVIGDTIDRLRCRIRGGQGEGGVEGESRVEDLVLEEEQVVPLHQEQEYVVEQQGVTGEEVVAQTYTLHTQHHQEEEVEYEYEEEEEEGDEEDDEEGGPGLTNMRYKMVGGEADGGQEMVVQVLPKAVRYLLFRSVCLKLGFTLYSSLASEKTCFSFLADIAFKNKLC